VKSPGPSGFVLESTHLSAVIATIISSLRKKLRKYGISFALVETVSSQVLTGYPTFPSLAPIIFELNDIAARKRISLLREQG